jgi:hypothetical protein
MKITDGTGGGFAAAVDEFHQLKVLAVTSTAQHEASERGYAYQVIGETATLTSATVPILHILNTSSTDELVFTYIRMTTADGNATIPAIAQYFGIGFGRTYGSGGTATVPVNMNAGSGNVAPATCYGNTPTLAGTNVEFEKLYNKAEGELYVFNKEGSIILPPNKTIEFYYVGTSTAGQAICRASFYTQPLGGRQT